MNVDTSPSVFLIGTQRSGTTLLCRMLSAHPDLFVQNELNVRKIFDSSDPSVVLKNIKDQINLEHSESLETLLARLGKRSWGLKDPELTEYLHQLEHFLPDTRFITIIRDGRAVVRSYMENGWGLGTNAFTGAQRWRREVEKQISFADRHPDSVLVIHYEKLVLSPEIQLRRVCDFLELQFDDAMLRYHELPAHFKIGRENATTFGIPDSVKISQWKDQLSDRQKAVIDYVAGHTLSCLGYEIEKKGYVPGSIEQLYYRVHQAIIGEIQIQYRWRLARFKNYIAKRLSG